MPDTNVTFVFTGQGSQYPGMGKELYEEDEFFKSSMDKCNDIYKGLKDGADLLETMFTATEEELEQTAVSQPSIVAIEWCLAQTLITRGVTPTCVLGHSVGEIAAACVAGAFSIETALELAVKRGEIMGALPSNNGVMHAVRQSNNNAGFAMNSVLTKMEQRHSIGVGSINGPRAIVLSGDEGCVNKVIKRLDAVTKQLKVSHAFHSPLMKAMKPDFEVALKKLGSNILQPLTIPLASTVTGEIIDVGSKITVEHWVEQVTNSVLFQKAFQETYKHQFEGKDSVVVEVGPKTTLGQVSKTLWRPKEKPLWASCFGGDNQDKISETVESITKRINDGP